MHTQQTNADAAAAQDRGRAFRRVGATVALACVLTGAAVGIGTLPASAATSTVAASGYRAVSVTVARTHHHPVKANPPKSTTSAADVRTFLRSAYAQDAINLAVVWGAPDLVTAKSKAGAKISAGIPLPFPPAKATAQPWTASQYEQAFFVSGTPRTEALAVAAVWGLHDVDQAKAKIGAALLTHTPTPSLPKTYSATQDVAAFHLAGYDDRDGAVLARLWHARSVLAAEVRAGGVLLTGGSLPDVG